MTSVLARWTLAIIALASLGVAAPSAGSTRTLILNADGLVGAPFGAAQRSVVAVIDRALGAPTKDPTPTPFLAPCGVDAAASWGELATFFDHGRFAGYALGHRPMIGLHVAGGVRPGERLSLARYQFGSRLRTSSNQGGAWFVRTPTGRFFGFLWPSGPPPGPRTRIWTIEAGRVGCPALAP